MTTFALSCPPDRGDITAIYPADPRAPRCARRHVEAVLVEWEVGRDVRSAAACITSELVTNAIRHTNTARVGLVLRRESQPRRLRVEVSDSAPELIPQIGSPDTDSESGRGLPLVRDLSQEYGVTKEKAHKTVWVELVW
ncbi:MAG TPA: ATP-binding protein [Polyangia bacterium]|jgi:anti-sigma regulatory factor (Ser/Thr protein kinase)|nr:ATP-binding protein [Polyangia bacterium]